MEITSNSVVSFDYILTAPDGTVIDQSSQKPLTYLHGSGQIVPGLERQLAGKRAGDELVAKVPAAASPSGGPSYRKEWSRRWAWRSVRAAPTAIPSPCSLPK
jgi:hypothetical protein